MGSLSDGVIEYAKTHEELKGAFLTFQKDADQIYPGWKEQLGYTGESSVQAASFDWKRKAGAATELGEAFFYERPARSFTQLQFSNDMGYLPDGTPMNAAGNAINHPETMGPDLHVAGSPLPPPFKGFVNDMGYLPDGTDMAVAGNLANHR